MKTFEAVFNNAKNKGVYSISLVESPAMEGDFIALSKDAKIEFKTVDEEQRILMGLVLEPNKPIYRNQDGEEFNIVFSEQTIKDLSQNFFKQGYQTNSSIEHSGDRIEGLSFYESWIVEDSKVDKSANFGLSYPKGSWIATMKVDNDEIWNEYVKSGKVLGFSIDAFVTLKEVKLKSDIEMAEEKKSFKEQVHEVLVSFGLTKEVKLGSMKSVDGVVLMYEGETPEAGAAVWLEGEEGVKVPVPVGEVPLEDGTVLVIAEEGIIGEMKAKAEEAQEEMNDAPQADAPAMPKEAVEAIKSILIKYSEEMDEKFKTFETKFSNMEKENKDLKEVVVELSNQPAAKSIKSTPSQKDYKDMSNYEKLKFNRGE